ncbi:MAG: DNA-processing protein DprA [Oscillospiraceae bacterium]|jgi:DNA processing protein|nr:DNA-processing protein DprA [Oscillospiraceae bacterium]
MSALKYWLWLSSLRGLGQARAAALIDALGSPENIYSAGEDEWLAAADVPEPALAELRLRSTDRAERILELCDRTNTRVLTMQDSYYPERLRSLYAPPCVLYYKGQLPSIDEEAALAVVGTRNPTAYGQNTALKLCYRLAAGGMLIVSGLAKGIDAAAHLGALRAGKPTVAVLGCGVDVVYPAENRELYEDIAAAGTLLSEYPPGTRAEGPHFPARNRIISGLSLGVLIVEAPAGSGALITASHALEQGRDVFAVPGNIDSRESEGCHRLIREGAILAARAEDVWVEYQALFPHKLTLTAPKTPAHMPRLPDTGRTVRPGSGEDGSAPAPSGESGVPVKAIDLTERVKDYPPDQQRILLTVAGSAMAADEIIGVTGLPAPLVLSGLTMLELDGVVSQMPGKRYTLNL